MSKTDFDLTTYTEIRKTINTLQRLLFEGKTTSYDLSIKIGVSSAELNSFIDGKNILSSTYYKVANYLYKGEI